MGSWEITRLGICLGWWIRLDGFKVKGEVKREGIFENALRVDVKKMLVEVKKGIFLKYVSIKEK